MTIDRVSHITIYVLDADEAKDFYTSALGFNVCADQGTGPHRWLTVVPPEHPDLYIALLEPETDVRDDHAAQQLRALISLGSLPAVFFETKDCEKTYDELTARGVEFTEPPTAKPYGIEATFKDNSGNRLVLLQH